MEISFSVSLNGPVFDRYETDMAMAHLEEDIEERLRDITFMRVRTMGQSMFRYVDKSRHEVPGKWLHSIHKGMGDGGAEVSTDIIYGYWLEGVGSRNAPKTRFAGYHMWRLTAQGIRDDAEELVQEDTDRAVERLNR
jgi:hypothetical protein